MVDELIKSGWTQTAPIHRGAEATFVFEQQGDEGLILEERGDGLWLWIEGTGDRRVFGLDPGEAKLGALIKALIGMQKTLTVDTYLEHYGTLGAICPTSIVAWEQFETAPAAGSPAPAAAAAAPMARGAAPAARPAAQAPAAPAAAAGGGDDPVVFPNGPLKRLSDYVGVMKGLQSGDFQGTLAKFGLDMMSYAAAAAAWGQKLASDPALAQKMAKMLMG